MIDYDDELESMQLVCDRCGDTVVLEGSFHSCIQKARDKGWSIERGAVSYEHYCDVCKSWN